MRASTFLVSAVAGLVLAAMPVAAHHAFAAEFDSTKPITLHGVVTKMEWINPHAWIHVDVKGDDGKVVSWKVESGAPNALLRRGFTKTYLLPGTEIIIDGYVAKDGSNRVNGGNVTLPDGRKLFLGSQGTGAPYDSQSQQK
jgi:hypothetical protein